VPDTGPALIAESGRVAQALGAELRTLAWDDSAGFDFRMLAWALASRITASACSAVLLADTTIGRQLAPLLALRLGSGAVLGCSDVRVDPSGLRLVKPVYGGWLEQEVRPAAGTVPVATIDLSDFEVTEAVDSGLAPVEVLDLAATAARAPLPEVPSSSTPLETTPQPVTARQVRHLELLPPEARSVDLVHAKRIVAAGMGAADEQLLAVVGELADLLEGSVGTTRPMVDDGLLPKERLIGQTGRTVAPDLYMALGVSGSPHHVAGVRKADKIVAVNRDTRAPIFQFSDVGYVADLRAVLPALVARIKEWRDAGE
jgi:electron transfer flavoprotein alpha subunit